MSFQLGGTLGTADQSAIAKTSITSESVAIALEGGKDNDRITNRGDLTVETGSDLNAKAIAVNVSIVGAGLTAQSAVADASGTSRATAAGILGGDGREVVNNESTTHIKATSNATTSGYSIGISGISIGAGVNKALSDTSNSAAVECL